MIKQRIELDNGEITVNLIPENRKDVIKLRRMKGLDDRHAFSDDPLMLPLESIQDPPPERQSEPPFLIEE